MALADLYTDGVIYIESEYREKDLIKTIPGAKWHTDYRMWHLPLSWAACVQMRGVLGPALTIGPALNAWAGNEITTRIGPCLDLRSAADAPELEPFPALFPFQRAGVHFLAAAGQALLGDDMGLGKTLQMVATLETLPDAYPALIVSPNTVKETWAKEFAKWAPDRRVVVVVGTADKRRKQIQSVLDGEADVCIVNWEGLRSHTRIAGYGSIALTDAEKEEKELNAIEWQSVVADEAHKGKDPTSKQTRALWYMGKDAKYRYAMTGTPAEKSPEDLWSIMHFVAPDEYPGMTAFRDRYALMNWSIYGFRQVTGVLPETAPELFKILDPRFIRRTKAAVLPQLPPKLYETRYVQMVGKQLKAYEDMRKYMLAELTDAETGESTVLMAKSPLTLATRLVQFAACHGEMVGEQLKLTEPSCKVDALEEIVAELGDQQALVFAESVQLIDIATERLRQKGYSVGQITGSIDTHMRQANVEAFQNGELQFLCITLGAGGEGLTLTAASVEIFLQRSFSAVKNLQAEDRAYGRLSDIHGVTIIDVVTSNSIEARVHEVRQEKAEMMEEIVRDVETLKKWLKK